MRICAYGGHVTRSKMVGLKSPTAGNEVRVRLPGNDETDQQSSNNYIFHKRELKRRDRKNCRYMHHKKDVFEALLTMSPLMIQFFGLWKARVGRAVKTFLSSRLIMNSLGDFGTRTKGTSSWGPRHLGTLWNLESRKWHFRGFQNVFSTADASAVSSEYTQLQDLEQCRSKCPRRSTTSHCSNVSQI